MAAEGNYAGARGVSLWQVEPTQCRYVKMTAAPLRDIMDGHYYVKIAELAIYETVSGNALRATWHATADDGSDAASGPAAEYDLRFSATPVDDTSFPACLRAEGLPSPSAKGAEEQAIFSVGALSGRIYAAMKARDEVPNWSDISNAAYADAAPAGLAPAAPADGVTLDPAGVPQFTFTRGPDVTTASVVISDRPDFPSRPSDKPGRLEERNHALFRGARSGAVEAFERAVDVGKAHGVRERRGLLEARGQEQRVRQDGDLAQNDTVRCRQYHRSRREPLARTAGADACLAGPGDACDLHVDERYEGHDVLLRGRFDRSVDADER